MWDRYAAAVLAGLASLAAASCTGIHTGSSPEATASCVDATIDKLWVSPHSYSGKRVCLSGFLGRMVPYGEDSAKLYATKEEAEATHSDRYVELDVPFSIQEQERLSRHSTEPLRAEGTFRFDKRCGPKAGQAEPEFTCFPPRPMTLEDAKLTFLKQGG